LVLRYFGKIGWFYVGTISSVAIIVTLVRLAYGQMELEWADLRGHMLAIMGIFVMVTFGPFVVFDLAEGTVDLLNNVSKPYATYYFWVGFAYPFLLVLYGMFGFFLNSHSAIFLFLVSLFSSTFLLPWLFVGWSAKRLKRINSQNLNSTRVPPKLPRSR